MTRHTVSHADELFFGPVQYNAAYNARRGAPMSPIYFHDFGAPVALDADAMVKAATSTELPNAETVTYTPDTDAVSPTDGVATVVAIGGVNYWVLDVPRNIHVLTTHNSSIVAMTVRVTGLDQYGQTMVEDISVAATGTSEVDSGLKAFKWVRSIAFTASGNAEANASNVGWGDALGLPFKLGAKRHVVSAWNADVAVALSTVTAAVATDPATATTGDVRGTITPATATDATRVYGIWYKIADPTSKVGTYGVAQYAG